MSPRTGRPTENPKRNYTGIRLSNDELDKLKFCMDKTGLSKTNIIRKGIDLVYNELTKKQRVATATNEKQLSKHPE